MATNAFSTYAAKGNREALENAIYNIDPLATPLMSLIGRRNVSNRQFDWQTEALPTSQGVANAQFDGFTNAPSAATATTRSYNVTMIAKRDATVTGSQQASDAAGKPEGEMAHQMALNGKALRIDMDQTLMGFQARNDGNTTTARVTRGLEHFLTTNVSSGSGYAAPADSVSALTDGTQRTFTKALLDTALQNAWVQGAEGANKLLCSADKKAMISGFAPRTGTQTMVKQGELLGGGVTVYISDWNDVMVLPTRNGRARSVLIVDPEYAKTAFFRTFFTKDLPANGDFDNKMIAVEYGLQVSNEKAHVKVVDLS